MSKSDKLNNFIKNKKKGEIGDFSSLIQDDSSTIEFGYNQKNYHQYLKAKASSSLSADTSFTDMDLVKKQIKNKNFDFVASEEHSKDIKAAHERLMEHLKAINKDDKKYE